MKKTKILVMLLALIAEVLLFSSCSGKTISLEKYVTTEIVGADGYGKIEAYFDSEALAAELMSEYSKAMKKGAEKTEYLDSSEAEFYAEMLAELFYADCDAEKLSNGDEAEVKILFEGSLEKIKEDTGLKFDASPVKVKVKGLEKVQSLDVFDNLQIELSGVSPELSVKLSEKETGKYGFYVTYSLADNSPYKYKIGDTLNVVAYFSEGSDLENGYSVSSLTKSIVIEKNMAQRYVTDVNEINAKANNIIKTDFDSKAASTFVKGNSSINLFNYYLDLSHAEDVSAPEFVKAYFAYSENPGLRAGYQKAKNLVLYVYKFNVSNAFYHDGWGLRDYTFDGDVYSYIFAGNLTAKGDEILYTPDMSDVTNEVFESEAEVLEFLYSYNYTVNEITAF